MRAALRENVAELDTVPITAALATLSTGAAIRAIEGDLPSAQRVLARIDDGDWPAAVRNDYPGAAYHLAKAIFALEALDLAEARRYIEPRPPHVDSIDVQAHAVAVDMLAGLAEGHHALVLQRLHRYLRAEDRSELPQPDRRVLVPVLALLDLARGQAGQAEQLLATLSPTSPVVLVLRALATHLTDDHDAVVGLLTRLETTATTPRIDAVAHLAMAASSLRAGCPDLAAVALEKLAAIMADCGMRAPRARPAHGPTGPARPSGGASARAGHCLSRHGRRP